MSSDFCAYCPKIQCKMYSKRRNAIGMPAYPARQLFYDIFLYYSTTTLHLTISFYRSNQKVTPDSLILLFYYLAKMALHGFVRKEGAPEGQVGLTVFTGDILIRQF